MCTHICRPCLLFARDSSGCLPVASGLSLLHPTCVSGQSLQDCSPAAPFVCCLDGLGAGTQLQEISTSHIRLMNPKLKLLAEGRIELKIKLALASATEVLVCDHRDTQPQEGAAHGLQLMSKYVCMYVRMERWMHGLMPRVVGGRSGCSGSGGR